MSSSVKLFTFTLFVPTFTQPCRFPFVGNFIYLQLVIIATNLLTLSSVGLSIDLISRLFLSVCLVQTADDINANELLSQANEKEFRRLFVSPFAFHSFSATGIMLNEAELKES